MLIVLFVSLFPHKSHQNGTPTAGSHRRNALDDGDVSLPHPCLNLVVKQDLSELLMMSDLVVLPLLVLHGRCATRRSAMDAIASIELGRSASSLNHHHG